MTFELAIAHSLKSLDDTNLDVNRHICKANLLCSFNKFSPIVPCHTPAVRLCHITMAKVNQSTFTFFACINMTKIDCSIVISSEFQD